MDLRATLAVYCYSLGFAAVAVVVVGEREAVQLLGKG
jgi:hypothetical protein